MERALLSTSRFEEPVPNYPLKIDDVKLTTEPSKYTNGISRYLLTISDIKAPIIVVNGELSFRVFYPSVLLSYVFTNMHKPKNWKYPQNDIPNAEIVSFALLVLPSCGVGVEHLYAENNLMRALYRFHVYYTVRRILWTLGVLLPAAPNFDLRKTSVDSIALEKIKQEFAVGVNNITGSLQPRAFNYDKRRFAQDGINGDYYYIHQLAG